MEALLSATFLDVLLFQFFRPRFPDTDYRPSFPDRDLGSVLRCPVSWPRFLELISIRVFGLSFLTRILARYFQKRI